MMRLLVLALVVYGCAGAEKKKRKATTASGCPEQMPPDEQGRVAVFKKIYGSWPPRISLPGRKKMKESSEWKAYHKKKEDGLMQLTDPKERWEFWLEQVQIRTLINFTETGWAMRQMPEELHEKVRDHFRSQLTTEASNHSVPLYTTGDQTLVHTPLTNQITQAVRKVVADWVGMDESDLEPTSTYGIRNYWKGSTLKTHVDRVETHILSAVYCVDAEYEEGAKKWAIETDPDLTGKHVAVDVQPGELFLYESAKLVHGRPSVLEGRYSAHLFIHFRPKGWMFKNVDRVYGVPPGFHDNQPLKRRDEL